MRRSLLKGKNLPKKFWGQAITTAVYLQNWVATTGHVGKPPYEVLFKMRPKVYH